MIKKILCAMLGLLFTISANAACNLYTTTNSSAGYIDGSGVVQNASSYLATDYIAVNSSTEYTVYIKQNAAISGHGVRIAFYDTNKQFISPRLGGDAPSAGQYIYNLTSPANAKYIRMSTYDGNSVVDRTIVQGRYTVDTIPTNMSQCATCDGTIVNYVSATGTVSQSGTPTPDNPIYPTFYTQGNMVLRKVGNVADSYDASTGKITRRVGVAVLDGTERWGAHASNAGWFQLSSDIFPTDVNTDALSTHYRQYTHNPSSMANQDILFGRPDSSTGRVVIRDAINFPDVGLADDFKSWLAQQYAAGTPVTVYYPLKTETTEDWPASYCETPIKIATTKYNETAFSPLNTALANAISVVDSVVSNTITQAASIATLQAQKQTRPANDTCPAYKQCLLVEDENGAPHWYEITDPFRDFVRPIIANNVNAASSTSTNGYTQLEYIESTGTQYIDTGVQATGDLDIKTRFKIISYGPLFGTRDVATGASNKSVWVAALDGRTIWLYNNKTTHNHLEKLNLDQWYDADINKGVLSFNGNEVASYETENFTGSDIFLFNTNEANGTLASGASVQISYFKIYDASGTLVRNFVPVVNNTTGKIGMYDTVGGRFYGNAATSGDDFTAGPIVENDADVPGMSWTATWAADASTGVSAGTVYGIARCNTHPSTAGSIITDTASTAFNTLGSICHCKMTSIDFEGSISDTNTAKWVHVDHANGGTKVCLQQCSTWCRGFTTMTERNKPVLSSVL